MKFFALEKALPSLQKGSEILWPRRNLRRFSKQSPSSSSLSESSSESQRRNIVKFMKVRADDISRTAPFVLPSFLLQPWNAVDVSAVGGAQPDSQSSDIQSSLPNASELVRSTRSAAVVVDAAKQSVAETLAGMHSSLFSLSSSSTGVNDDATSSATSTVSGSFRSFMGLASGSREKTRNETSTAAEKSPEKRKKTTPRLSAAPGGRPACVKDPAYYRHLVERYYRHVRGSQKFFKACRVVEDESSSGGSCRLVFPEPISTPVVLKSLRKIEQRAKELRRKLMADSRKRGDSLLVNASMRKKPARLPSLPPPPLRTEKPPSPVPTRTADHDDRGSDVWPDPNNAELRRLLAGNEDCPFLAVPTPRLRSGRTERSKEERGVSENDDEDMATTAVDTQKGIEMPKAIETPTTIAMPTAVETSTAFQTPTATIQTSTETTAAIETSEATETTETPTAREKSTEFETSTATAEQSKPLYCSH